MGIIFGPHLRWPFIKTLDDVKRMSDMVQVPLVYSGSNAA
jgi:hypothetical protein